MFYRTNMLMNICYKSKNAFFLYMNIKKLYKIPSTYSRSILVRWLWNGTIGQTSTAVGSLPLRISCRPPLQSVWPGPGSARVRPLGHPPCWFGSPRLCVSWSHRRVTQGVRRVRGTHGGDVRSVIHKGELGGFLGELRAHMAVYIIDRYEKGNME